jgi:uncharacterized RmlC-like cupin family protein
MISQPNVLAAGVRILRHGQFDAAVVQGFLPQALAEITHLPTGATSSELDTLTIPPGGAVTRHPEGSASTLVHVVAGQIKLSWGTEFEHTARAGSGDALLIPAGIAFQALNDSPVDALQLILVRGN